jgi:hypothetical protein
MSRRVLPLKWLTDSQLRLEGKIFGQAAEQLRGLFRRILGELAAIIKNSHRDIGVRHRWRILKSLPEAGKEPEPNPFQIRLPIEARRETKY